MHEKPRDPCDEAAELQAAQVRHGPCPPDRGQVALVAVTERRRRPPGEPVADEAPGVAPFLHGHGREPGERVDVAGACVADRHHVADGQHGGMPGQREIRLHRHAPSAVELSPGRACEDAGER